MRISFEEAQKAVAKQRQCISSTTGPWQTIEKYFANPPIPPAPTDEAKLAARQWLWGQALLWSHIDKHYKCCRCKNEGPTEKEVRHTDCPVATIEAALAAPTETPQEERKRVLGEMEWELGQLTRTDHAKAGTWCLTLQGRGQHACGNSMGVEYFDQGDIQALVEFMGREVLKCRAYELTGKWLPSPIEVPAEAMEAIGKIEALKEISEVQRRLAIKVILDGYGVPTAKVEGGTS